MALLRSVMTICGRVLSTHATAQGLVSSTSASPAPANAQSPTQLSDIVVTAQKRSQNLQDVPIAITVMNAQQLSSRAIDSVEGLTNASPGLFVQEFGASPAESDINIRGVGQLDVADHQESPNAVYLDGAYVSFQGATGFGLFDVDQIEVLRGPQGTLFGRNATGGLIQINSRKPTDKFEGYIQTEYGSYNQSRTEGALNLPVNGNVYTRLSVSYNRQDGYIRNDSGPDGGSDNTLNARYQIAYKSNAGFKNLIQIFVSRSFPVSAGYYDPYSTGLNPANHGLAQPDSGSLFLATCAGLGFTGEVAGDTNCWGYKEPNNGPWKVSIGTPGRFDRLILGFTNTLSYELPFATLTSITNYTHLDKHYLESGTPQPINYLGYGNDTNAKQASEELRLNGAQGPLHWVSGLYALRISGNYDQYNLFGSTRDPSLTIGSTYHQKLTSYAAFGQVDYSLTTKISVIGGFRLGRDVKSLQLVTDCSADCEAVGGAPAGQTVGGKIHNTAWSGRFQLTYKLDRHVMIYGGVNRGTKGAAIQAPSFPTPGLTFDSLIIKPEVLTDYEAGFKSDLFGRRLRLNADVFYYNYHNYQAFKTDGLNALLFNAEARDYGAEMDVSALVTRHLTASFGLALLHTKVEGVVLPDGTVSTAQQPFAPHSAATADLRQEWPIGFGNLFLDGSATYNGSRYFSTVNQLATFAPAYVTGTITFGYASPGGNWTITGKVVNVNNKIYAVYAGDNTSIAGFTLRNVAPPRWFQLEVGHKF